MVEVAGAEYSFRTANEDDFATVLEWLRFEYEEMNGREHGFWCNRNLIEDGFQSGELLVMVHDQTQKARAFSLGLLVGGGGIFVVHPQYRGRGLGRALFEFIKERARAQGFAGLYIEPVEEYGNFWERRCFRVITGPNGRKQAILPFGVEVNLPAERPIERLRIELLDPKDDSTVMASQTIEAGVLPCGTLRLAQRFIEYTPSREVFVRVLVNEAPLWNEKIKYSSEVGINYQSPFVFIDEVAPHAGGANA